MAVLQMTGEQLERLVAALRGWRGTGVEGAGARLGQVGGTDSGVRRAR